MKKYVTNLEPNSFYHIFNKGINGNKIFFSSQNYSYFLKLLKDKVLSVSGIYAYCFLPNHFHILIKTKSENEIRESFSEKAQIDVDKIISQQFSNVFNSYTQAVNKNYSRTGKLFELPFRRRLITSDDYLIKTILYIHNNPKKHFLTNEIFSYQHSSLPQILNNNQNGKITKEIISLFGSLDNFRLLHQNYDPIK